MEFCDLECRHASFPTEDALDGSRSCRTFVALYCALKKAYVHKNLPCADKAAPPARTASGKGRPGRKKT